MTAENNSEPVEFTPRPFGRYFLIDKLAVGGMAEIYKAVFLGLRGFDLHLVIKRILPNLSENPDFIELFVKEAKIYSVLRHHNIVQIVDFGALRSQYFIAMEHVDGKDLKQLLMRLAERKEPLPTEVALYICQEICKGLDYVHNCRDREGHSIELVHRDLTPANILMSYAGEVKIADFGIAKARINAEITKAGALKGKYEYMSPEQARGENVDSRSDIFAVGILLYEMLTGRRLFKTGSDTETLEKVRTVAIQPPNEINPRISPRLNQIILRCLHPSKEARFQEAKNLQQAILTCLRPTTVAATEEVLSTLLSTVFEADRSREVKREIKNKNHVRKLQENEDSSDDDDILLYDTSTALHFSLQEKKIIGLFSAVIVALLCVIFQISSAPKAKEIIVNRRPTTNLNVTVIPEDAEGNLWLNNEDQGMGTSFRIEHLSPNEELKLRYQSNVHLEWQQTITIRPNESTSVFIHLAASNQ